MVATTAIPNECACQTAGKSFMERSWGISDRLTTLKDLRIGDWGAANYLIWRVGPLR